MRWNGRRRAVGRGRAAAETPGTRESEGAICMKAWALPLGEKAQLSSVPQFHYDLIDRPEAMKAARS